jgi:hypothetical protein
LWALAPTRTALQLQQPGPGLFFFLLLGIGTSVSHLEVGKRQFTCRQMAVIAVFAAQRGSRRRAYRFLDPLGVRFAGPTPFPLGSLGDLYPTFEVQYAISQRQTCDNIYRSDISILCDNNIAATKIAIYNIVAPSIVAFLTAAISQQHKMWHLYRKLRRAI